MCGPVVLYAPLLLHQLAIDVVAVGLALTLQRGRRMVLDLEELDRRDFEELGGGAS